MPHLYLPTEHTDADLVLATQVAEAVDAAELFVVWGAEAGQGTPEIVAVVREPEPHPIADAFIALMQSVANLVTAIGRRGQR